MPPIFQFLCLTLAVSTLAERLDSYEQPFHRRYRVDSYPLTNTSAAILTLSSTSSKPTALTTTTPDLTNVYMQPPRITSSPETKPGTTFGSSNSHFESTASTISASNASNVYMQRLRTTSSLTTKYKVMPSGSLSTSYASHPSAGMLSSSKRRSSSASHAANETTLLIPPFKSKTSTRRSNFTTTFTPAICSGTTTILASSNAPRTRTVTETYFVTIFGVLTDFAPPPVSTPLPFCVTVGIPYRSTTSSTRTCSGTDLCITLMHTTFTTIASATIIPVAPATESLAPSTTAPAVRPEFITTWKHTQTVFIGDTTPPSFDPTSPVPAQPIQTGPDVATPTQGRNVQTESGAQPPHSGDLGGIIASIFNNPFTAPNTAPSASAGDSSNGGSPNGGGESNGGSPGPGGWNGQNSSPAPPAQNAPEGSSQHDNPAVEMTTASVLVSFAASQIVVGEMTFPANMHPTTVAIEGQTFSINPSQVIASGITLNLPPPPSFGAAPRLNSPASVSIDIKSNNIVIGGHTFTAGSPPTSTVIGGQTFAVNAAQQAPGAAITAPPSTFSPMAPTLVTVDNIPLAIQSGNIVIGGQTFSSISSTSSVVIDGQTFTINPSQVIAPGTTIDIPSAAPANSLSEVTAGGLTFSVGATVAVISGTTYAVGGAASPMTKVIGGQAVSFGPGGIGFASTTVPVAALSQVTAGGLTFFVGSTEAFISGTTYAIGNGATATTTVIGGQTVSFGPNGVGLASTTVPAPTASSTVGSTPVLQLFVGSASDPSIQGAAIGTLLAFGVGILLLL